MPLRICMSKTHLKLTNRGFKIVLVQNTQIKRGKQFCKYWIFLSEVLLTLLFIV